MIEKFFKPEVLDQLRPYMNPVDFFNKHGDFVSIFTDTKRFMFIDSNTVHNFNSGENPGVPTHKLNSDGLIEILISDEISAGTKLTKFEALTVYRFDGIPKDAMNYVEFRVLKKEIPFLRVGTDYFKTIFTNTRYGQIRKLKPWKKDEIKQDYGKNILNEIARFDEFYLNPDNLEYKEFENNCYNLYAKFPHKPSDTPGDFKHIDLLMKHIFGDQIELGYRYLQVLYTMPKQILPVLVLASTERQTGKTTFLNFLDMLFGDNYVNIPPDDLVGDFNNAYATKNIIAIDETVLEKSSSVEKIKAIATQKSIVVNQKYVSHFKVDFFGKIIIGTNREHDFMKIDEEEIRFWVRRVPPINQRITNIEDLMRAEIPYMLHYLLSLPNVDLSKSRMVFTEDEIRTETLGQVMNESKSWLRKDLELRFEDLFMQNKYMSKVEFAAIDLKEKWYANNHQVTSGYLFKVLKNEMKLQYSEKIVRYKNFGEESKTGKPFTIQKVNFMDEDSLDDVPETDEDTPF